MNISDSDRNSVFPVKHLDLWELYKNHLSVFWICQDVDCSEDKQMFNKLNKNEQKFIKHILAFFSKSDLIVGKNLIERLMNDINILEASFFYGIQNAIENIHSEMYSVLIDTLIDDNDEKNQLFNAVETIPCVSQKIKWVEKWIKETTTIDQQILVFSIVEGIFFSGSFAGIFWLKERRLCPPGLIVSNEFIARDEGLHTNFACHLYKNYVKSRVEESEFHQLLNEAVNIEIDFFTESLPTSLIGMNIKAMIQYIKFVANRHCLALDYNELYDDISNPFGFMNFIGMFNKSNFFEKRVSEYAKHTEYDDGEAYAGLDKII